MFPAILRILLNFTNKHAPLRAMSRREKRLSRKPWISNDILQQIKTKNRLFRTHYRSNDPIKKQIYKKHLNKLTHVKCLAKRQYYKNVIKNNQDNSRQTWSVMGKIIDYKNTSNQSKMISSTVEINNHAYDTNSETFLDKVCNYFANVGSLMCKNLPNQHNSNLKIYFKRSYQSFAFHEITENEVNKCINNIKNYSAPGLDEITPKFIKLGKVVLAPFLTKIFNKRIAQQTFPENFKMAAVIPIPKNISPKTLCDFCPISLLPIFSKLFEKIIAQTMMNYINRNKILSASQFGFRTNSSTDLAGTSIYNKLLQNMDDKKVTCSIFLDLQKAFDSVDHTIILKKLNHYGFRGSIL